MAMFIWFGATQALVVAKLRERIPGLSAPPVTRRAISVDARTTRWPRRCAGRTR